MNVCVLLRADDTVRVHHDRQALSSLLLQCKIIKLINEAMINSVTIYGDENAQNDGRKVRSLSEASVV